MEIKIQYEDRYYFHPSPSVKMEKAVKAILEKFGWVLDIPPSKNHITGEITYELTRSESKEIISKGVKKAKRDKVKIFDSEFDKINRELAS